MEVDEEHVEWAEGVKKDYKNENITKRRRRDMRKRCERPGRR